MFATSSVLGQRVYLPVYYDRVNVVDTQALTISDQIDIPPAPGGMSQIFSSIAIHPTLPRAYLGHYNAQRISIVDTASNSWLSTIDLTTCPGAPQTTGPVYGLTISPNGAKLYAAGASATVWVLSAGSNTVVDCIALGQPVTGIAVSPDGVHLYAAGYSLLFSIDLSTRTFVTTPLPFSLYDRSLAVSPDGSRIFVPGNPNDLSRSALTERGQILVLNAATLETIAQVRMAPGPTRLALSRDGSRLYVTNSEPPRSLTEINTATLAWRAPTYIGASAGGYYRALDTPIGLAINAAGDRVYIMSWTGLYPGDDDDLFVVDTTTLAATGRVVIDHLAPTIGQFVSWQIPPVAEAGPNQTVECAGPAGSLVQLDGSGSHDPEGGALQFEWKNSQGELLGSTALPSFTLPLGTNVLTLTVRKSNGTSASDTVTILVRDTTAPVTTASFQPANSGGWHSTNVTVVLNSTDACSGVKQIIYSLAGAESGATTVSDAIATLSLSTEGTTVLNFHAGDSAGNIETPHELTFRIDKTAPQISCSAKPNLLWPPNHRLAPVTVAVDVTDDLSGPAGFLLTAASSNQPDLTAEKEDLPGDIQAFDLGSPDTSGLLRAERTDTSEFRLYSLVYQGFDRAGNSATCRATVMVPRSQGQ